MRTVIHDIRYCLRMLIAHPTLTLAAVLCLALGIGSTTAIFSVVNAVLLKPLPYNQPDRLVRLYTEFPNFPKGGLGRFWMSPPELDELQRNLKSWQSLGVSDPLPLRGCPPFQGGQINQSYSPP